MTIGPRDRPAGARVATGWPRRDAAPLLIAATAALGAAACGGPASTLDPGGPAAQGIATLWWILVLAAGGIYAVVVLALVLTARGQVRIPARRADAIVAGAGLGALGIVVALLLVSVRSLAELTRPEPAALVVEVVGRQYWWALHYRDGEATALAVAANELHLPQGRRVEVRLHSMDVIHSFWVPSLQGKLDLIPGKTNVTWVRGDRTGVYHGQCAEYCGMQHALMRLTVVVQRPDEFDAWLAAQRAPAPAPAGPRAERGQQLFMTHCAQCHAIRGTAAFFGHVGPDLTHLGARRTLGAGTVPNTPEHLASWLADPQAMKPGNLMPRIPLAPEDFHVLLEYLTGLK